MKKILTLLLFNSILITGFSQYDFLFERKSLSELRTYEDSIKSENIGFVKSNVATDYFPTAKEGVDYYPLSYHRTNDNFYPDLHVQYYYTESDSILLSTVYDWNIMDYVKNLKTEGSKLEKETKRSKEYLAKYESIKSDLIKKYGKPTSTEEEKNSEGYFYRLKWENESIDILVLLKFSKKLKSFGEMKFGSFNIRVKVDYK
ncbi:MAG: hypothetical protein QNK23_13580 [Crocinitomicaceae bacterium]|nr:hypothetical protein [Crocinitomicaceae bacterium]